jgi:hypothetical protein
MAHAGDHAADRTDATALLMAERGQTMSWADLHRKDHGGSWTTQGIAVPGARTRQ